MGKSCPTQTKPVHSHASQSLKGVASKDSAPIGESCSSHVYMSSPDSSFIPRSPSLRSLAEDFYSGAPAETSLWGRGERKLEDTFPHSDLVLSHLVLSSPLPSPAHHTPWNCQCLLCSVPSTVRWLLHLCWSIQLLNSTPFHGRKWNRGSRCLLSFRLL